MRRQLKDKIANDSASAVVADPGGETPRSIDSNQRSDVMKRLLAPAFALAAMSSAALAAGQQPSHPVKMNDAQMDQVVAGALVNVNATALNNVSANVPVSANVVALSSGVTSTANSAARSGNPV